MRIAGYTLLLCMLALTGLGLVVITSIGDVQGGRLFDDPDHFWHHQLLFGFVAMAVCAFVAAVPTRLCLVATTFDGEPDRVRALALQLVHEGSRRAFKRVEKLFDDGTVADTLAFDATLPTLREILGVEDLVTGPTRAIAFGCTCSLERFLAAYAALPRKTLEGMLRPLRPREERCHLCGRRYTITPEHLVKLLQDKTETKGRFSSRAIPSPTPGAPAPSPKASSTPTAPATPTSSRGSSPPSTRTT